MRQSLLARFASIVTSITLTISSIGLSFIPTLAVPAAAAGPLATDKVVSKHQTTSSTSVVSPAFTTAQAGELLVAFVTTDGPATSGGQQFTSVTGGGLTWTLRQRTNVRYGTAEIWQAVAPAILTNATVTATHSGSYQASIVVASFTGADTSVNGAVATANAATGAPAASITTTRAGSWVWGVGNDWSSATARTVGTNQTKVDEYLASTGDTFWVQRQNAVTPASGTSVTINDTAPTADMWNLSLIEILPSGAPDTTAPTAPTNLTATATAPTNVNLTWSAATDNVGVANYQILRGGTQIGTTSGTSYSDTSTVGSTTYSYTVRALDAAGNVSPDSAPATVTTPAPDTTAPVISAISSGTPTQSGAIITWTTNEPASTQVDYGTTTAYGSSTTLNSSLVTSHSQALTGLTASTVYHFRVKSADASSNLATSGDNTFTTAAPAADTTAPTVSITSPIGGSTVSGSIPVTASASDNVGVAGVQFKLDGANLAAEDAASPYSIQWDTTTATAGSHTLTAVARDAAGNTATSASVVVSVNNASGSDPSAVGAWGPVVAWPEVSIHAALTYTGKILTFQGDFTQGGQQYLLDPSTGNYTQVPNAAADLFCAGQAVLPDGRILVVGGTATSGGLGIKAVTAFNPATEVWQTMAPMNHARWYATGTTLSDGRVLVTSGANTSLTDLVQVPEIYDTQHNTWTDLTSATHNIPMYPFMYQLPDGRVLWAGASEVPTQTEVLSSDLKSWSTVDSRIIDGSSIANYAPGKFMKAGSAADDGNTGNSVNTAYTLDMNQPNPTWQPTGSMAFPRSFTNLTNLPDGTVLATGGGTDRTGFDETHAVLPAEIWNPATGTWTTVASMTTPRLYHSTAQLLPDGRVFVSGSGGDPGVPDEKNYQIYSPAYLYKGARPTITSVPSTVQYNASTFVQTPNAANITRVSLIRTGSGTHSFDQNARALSLSFTQTAGGLNVQMPQNGNFAPPGYYMLSIVDSNGVPSVASFVRFAAPFEDNVAPSAPTNLTASGSLGKADLSWSAASDNIGVAKYDVYRSTTPGFVPSPANQVAQVSGSTLTYTDSNLAPGTYYYQVKAEDAASNISPSSNEASAVVPADTSAPTTPANLQAVPGSGQVGLTWTASTDNVGVARYNIIRDGVQIGTSTSNSYTDSAVTGGSTYTYTVSAQDAAGNVSSPSAGATATVSASAPKTISIDKLVTGHQSSNSTTVSATGLTTTGTNELLLAFISSDGGSGASISSVSGGGLTWTLRQRSNGQAGTAEIWQAVAPGPLSNVTVTATQASGSWQSSLNVAAFLGADTAAGAVASANASSGAPNINLTTTRAGSWVWGVGTDWDKPVARTVGANQTLVDQFLPPAGDTYWLQRQNTATPTAGTVVTINDTAPTADRWNLAAIEILPAP